jgi:hemolysin III
VKPLLRGHFHQAMFFIMIGAGVPLLSLCETSSEKIAVSIYLTCALLMFGVSTLYHRVTWSPERRLLWKKLDHAGIYFMIAGTFTPIAMLALDDASGFKLLTTIWTTTFIGIIQSLFFVSIPKYISALIYLVAGYLVLPYLKEIHLNAGTEVVILIFAGGAAYTLGALSYGLKWPNFNPKFFGYHEVFHIFVNIAAAIHFVAILILVNK